MIAEVPTLAIASPPLPRSSVEQMRDALLPSLEVKSHLGDGGMGSVFLAWEPTESRHVAVKVIAVAVNEAEARAGLTLPQGFLREADALSRLSHPHIVSLYRLGSIARGLHYLVMEYVPGSCLHTLMQSASVSPGRFLSWLSQISSALQHAHDAGLVHRDVKPSNILINSVGAAKLIDFGLVRAPGLESFDSHWRFQSVGTPDYAAPEALEDGHQAGHRADIFSLGVILYEMLCGRRPTYPYIPPTLIRPQLDPRFDLLLARALQGDPEKRYQQAAHFKADLLAIITGPA